MTVSRVLTNPEMVKPETRARVQEAIDKAGFVPNRLASSIRGNGRIVGTVVPTLINSGIAEQVQGMSDECQASGYSMLLVQGEFTSEAEEEAIRTILGWRPAGLILQSFVQSSVARSLLKSNKVPVVEISEVRGNVPLGAAVGISNFDAAFTMTMHLATKGYRHIGFVSMPVHGNDRLQQRRAGYMAAMAQLGVTDSSDMEVQVPISARGGADALIQLTTRRPDVDVIFFSSDALAMGAIQECHRRRWKIPQRIGIAGFGDLEFAAELFPSLTTVRIDRYQMGREAVRHLVARLSGNSNLPTVTSLGFQIIDRESA
jgi:LacI family gluconate utilization system Gnt-I transcriptional repressor